MIEGPSRKDLAKRKGGRSLKMDILLKDKKKVGGGGGILKEGSPVFLSSVVMI